MPSQVRKRLLTDETGQRIAAALELQVMHNTGLLSGTVNWEEISASIEHGMGAHAYPVGHQFPVAHTTYGVHKFNVIGQDHDLDAHHHKEHTMTLQMDDQLEGTPFDMPEALYYAANGLVADTYCFTIQSGYDEEHGGGKTYHFTLTQNVPAGGQVCFGWGYNAQASASKITTYASANSTTAIEQVSVEEGTLGVFLGTADARTDTMNHIHCVRYGYNRWSQSAIRQWLNSSAAANAWWTPQNVFDRPPSYASRPGYLAGFDAEFVAVLGEITHSTALNTLIDGGGSETVTDKVFLLSRAEVFGTQEVAGADDGSIYEFFEGAVNADRIKLRNGSAAHWWLRTPYASRGSHVRLVGSDGSLNGDLACYAYGAAPACVIM